MPILPGAIEKSLPAEKATVGALSEYRDGRGSGLATKFAKRARLATGLGAGCRGQLGLTNSHDATNYRLFGPILIGRSVKGTQLEPTDKKGGLKMAFYLYQLSYSKEAVKAMVASPSDREAAARKLIEALGGKLHNLFFAFGEYDVICLIEGPDDKMMMAGAAAVASAGTVSKSSTVKLMTAADAMAAMTLAGKVTGAYKPPQG